MNAPSGLGGTAADDVRRPDRIVSVDWGIRNQLYALGTSSTRAASRDRWPQFRAADNREGLAAWVQYQDRFDRRVLRGADSLP